MGYSRDKDETIRALEETYLEMIVGVNIPREDKSELASLQPALSFSEPDSVDDAFSIVISPDRMTVSLCATGVRPVAIGKEDIYRTLDRKGIITGLNRDAIVSAALQLQTSGGWQGEIIVARGKPADNGPTPCFPFLERLVDANGVVSWGCGGEPLDFPRLQRLLTQLRLEEIRQSECRVRVVVPGEIIVTFDRPPTVDAGVDVFGQPIAATPLIVAGENVRIHPPDNSLRSMLFGFLHIEGNIVSVFSPIWITADRMNAIFISMPQVGEWRPPSVSQLESLLRMKGVAEVFIRPDILALATERLKERETGTHFVKIAAGFPVRSGENAKFTYFFEAEAKSGTLREGDVFDLKERGLIISVHKGVLLAEKILATKGSDGRTLFGETLKAVNGEDINIHTTEGIIEEKQEGKILYRAKHDGVVSFKDNRLTFIDLFEVKGDVDYNTGNIEVTTPVLVHGSMMPGFTIKSGGDVHIRGSVEMDCTVVAHGNLCVDGGILGGKTRIVVFGGLRTSFIQNAEVITQGDVLAKSYIYNASVRCGGTVTVRKGFGERGGKIIGGIVCATRGIHASAIGSESHQDTTLILQNKPEDLLELGKIDAELKQCSEKLLKFTRTLNMDSPSPQRLKEMIAAIPPGKRDAMLKVFHMLNQMIKLRDSLTNKKKEFRAKMEQELSEGAISATSTFYKGNTVQIGDCKLVVSNDLTPATFRIKDGVILKN